MNRTPPKLVLSAFGWLLRIDTYGVALHATDRWAADQAAEVIPDPAPEPDGHDCAHAHPDGPCDEDEGAYTEDDLLGLLTRARNGEHPVELFVAGTRAEPGEGSR